MSVIERLRASRRTSLAVGLSLAFGVAVPAVAVVAGFAVGVLGPLSDIDTPTAKAAAAGKAQGAAALGRLPALTDLTAALTAGGDGWSGTGSITSGASLPTAVSCVPSPITPVVTLSRGYTVDSAPITVTLAAYVAGAGGLVFNSEYTGIPACTVPGGSETVAAGAATGPGTARFSVTTYVAGQQTVTQVWRRGDVIAFLSGTDPTTEPDLATAMDQALQHALGSDCPDQDSLATDSARDPFAVTKAEDFKGYTVDQGINQSPTPLPSPTQIPGYVLVPVEPAAAASGSAAPATPEAVQSPTLIPVSQGPLGTPLPAVAPAAIPSKPPWPVYPPLPSSTPAPIAPSVPASQPPTHAPLRESQVDAVGPGCGWAFTGMIPPTPPTVLTASALAAKQAALQPLLARDQAAWQVSVNTYWAAYTAYLSEVSAYATYTDAVNQVSAAWSVIDGNWQTYFTLKAAYDKMVADRKKFLSDQQAAAAAYAANQASCTPTAAAVAPVDPAAPAPAAPNDAAAPSDAAAPHARAADTPTPSPTPTTGGGGLFPTFPASSPTPSAGTDTPTAAPTDTAVAPTDAPPVTATTAPAPAAPVGAPCEDPPAILSQTPPPAPSGPPPTKPADPRPASASAAAPASASPKHS